MSCSTRRLLTPLLVFVLGFGCGKTRSNADAMGDAIRQHLMELKTLNLSAMNFHIDSISMRGRQAHVEVTFQPKTGAPPGAGMQVAYLLEKRDSGWSVVKTESVGGIISHPPQGTNPHSQPTSSSTLGNIPNFHELIPSPAADTNPSLPPGHPPINPTVTSNTQKPVQPR